MYYERFEDMICDIEPCDILADNFGAPANLAKPETSYLVQQPADWHRLPDCCEVRLPSRAPGPGETYVPTDAVAVLEEGLYGPGGYSIRTPRGYSTYLIKDQLKAIGARWDGSQRRWWITWDKLYPYADMGMVEMIEQDNRRGYGLMGTPGTVEDR